MKIHPILAGVLETHRESLNGAFMAHWRLHPELTAADVFTPLTTLLSPLISAAARESEAGATRLAEAACRHIMTLAAKGYGARGAWGPLGERVWQDLLVPLAPQLSQGGPGLLAALLNATCHLSSLSDRMVSPWVEAMARGAALSQDEGALLALGKVLAWKQGMAANRQEALGLLGEMAPGLRAVVFPEIKDDKSWQAIRQAFVENPWFVPGVKTKGPLLAAVVGGFRGLGGPFLAPPEVCRRGDTFYCRSAGSFFTLQVDGFGQSVHKIPFLPESEAPSPGLSYTPLLSDGVLTLGNQRLALDVPGHLTSFAFGPHTAAVTASLSHYIFFVALE